ncbi:1-phosphatidylinositol 4,5-bisphosphate phosphodiesterase delta-3 [Cyanistes caeruleus]|uniref:1-phosphatidylinositol 4,5-bisphosphate phosphodiesterase delta-3 n=1 Tax=Cyanistes caeruleus TaxID=156563 RepID=UPI000CDA192D|nr:1-phosphatidylinositol 4,5-bisphosphate phosphodiesterase delta-3 [Cyanistes caeruleus]
MILGVFPTTHTHPCCSGTPQLTLLPLPGCPISGDSHLRVPALRLGPVPPSPQLGSDPIPSHPIPSRCAHRCAAAPPLPVPQYTLGTSSAPSSPSSPGSPGLVPAGLTEDEDVQRMLQGSLLWKVKAKGGSRERLFRLQEDGVTVCFEGRFRHARSPQSFSVANIEGVREGRRSEGLRKHGAAFPERHCFTLAFKGRRKNLDLAARGEEDARHWVQGLTKLMGRLQAMSQMEKLDHWIHGVLQRADRNKDNKMSFREVKSMLRMLNIDMDDVYASKLFKECDHSGNERLEGRELEEFCRRLLRRPELEELFGRYSGEDRVLSAEELQDFLRDQGEDSSLRQARTIIRTYELNEKAKRQDLMMLDGFMMYLLSAAGDILNQEHTKVHQDMNQPLSHYFISSSHNTYLTRNQIGGTSSTEAYVRALRAGCRCVELDCWEGSDGEPVVYHGHTLTSKILFRDVIESIRDSAFEVRLGPAAQGCWVWGPSWCLSPGPQLPVPQVITAQQLPKLNRDKGSSIVDPFVRVEIHGVPADCAKQQTHHKLNNGFNPRWEETLRFQVRVPELALVRFVVEDYDSTSCNDFVGQFTLPLPSMRQGYRHIHLLSKDGASLSPATLFVHVRCKSL